MNYIQQLKQDLARERAVTQATRDGLDALAAYLRLPKFHSEPYVNVDDVFLRMNEIKAGMSDARFAEYTGNEPVDPIENVPGGRYAEARYNYDCP